MLASGYGGQRAPMMVPMVAALVHVCYAEGRAVISKWSRRESAGLAGNVRADHIMLMLMAV